MKRTLPSMAGVALACCLLCFLYYSRTENVKKNESEKAQSFNTIVIQFSDEFLPEERFELPIGMIVDSKLTRIFRKFGVRKLHSVFKNRYDKEGCLKREILDSKKILMLGWFKLRLDSKLDSEKLIKSLSQHHAVVNVFIEKPLRVKSATFPNDPSYSSQWHLNNPSNPNFDINAELAWDINTGRNDVIVAILDGGVDYNHPDLDPGDRSRIIQGYDTGEGDSNPMDDLGGDGFAGHGTMVAGVVGAIPNNNKQVSGVMWNCKIMPVKMVRSGGIHIPHILDWDWSESAFPSDVADAIDYAISHGAHVINLSYSFPNLDFPLNEMATKVPLVAQAIERAYQNNVVITASMGNEYFEDNGTRYPAGFDQVIAVGATERDGRKSGFSNTGNHIDLSAPGNGIWTTERGGGVTNPNGTSFSAPIVAGVSGLVISQGKDRGFNLTNDDVKHIMELTATDLPPTIGFDAETGHGIVNAHKALELIDNPNVLYHYNTVGGSAVKNKNLEKWILLDGRWGIAAAMYLDVDEYKITKHVDFDVPFCSLPKIWMRERESSSMNFSNPNNARPYVKITNLTNTGFDLEYALYYVRYDAQGKAINKWLPANPSSTNVAYTVVGRPNITEVTSQISGNSQVCNTNTVYTITNVPANSTITWSTSGHLSYVSGQGTSSYTVKSLKTGKATINVSITNPEGCITTTRTKMVWSGAPSLDYAKIDEKHLAFGSENQVCNSIQQIVDVEVSGSSSTVWSRTAAIPNNTTWSQSGNDLRFYFWNVGQMAAFKLSLQNSCGTKSYDFTFESKNCSGSCNQFVISPNPSKSILNVAVPNIPAPCSTPILVSENFSRRENNLEIGSIEILNGNGETIFALNDTQNKKNVNVDLTDYGNGLFYLKVTDRTGTYMETQRIIIE